MQLKHLEGVAEIAEENLRSHATRSLEAVRSIAGTSGAELAAAWFEAWDQTVDLDGAVETTEAIQRQVGRALPLFAELVVSLDGGAARIAWLSGGRAGAHLAETVSNLLRSSVAAHLALGGDRVRAVKLASLFRAAFPSLDHLRKLSGLAQSFVVGVAPLAPRPDAQPYALKCYLNPRVSPGDPREHLAAIGEEAGLARSVAESAMARVYSDAKRWKLYGLGVDLVEDAPSRLKLYVRSAFDALPLAEAPARIRREIERFVEVFRHASLANEVESAIALHADRESFKATRFWTGRRITHAEEGEVLRWIESEGFEVEPLQSAIAPLRAPGKRSIQRSPLHALGLEVFEDGHRKLNVYLQPEL